MEVLECLLGIFASKAFPGAYTSPLFEESELEKEMVAMYDAKMEERDGSRRTSAEWEEIARFVRRNWVTEQSSCQSRKAITSHQTANIIMTSTVSQSANTDIETTSSKNVSEDESRVSSPDSATDSSYARSSIIVLSSDVDSRLRKRTSDTQDTVTDINNNVQDDTGALRRSSRNAAAQASTALQAIDTNADDDDDIPDKQPKKKQKVDTCCRGALHRAVMRNDCGGLADPKKEIHAIYAKMASFKDLDLPAFFGTLLDFVRSNTIKLPSLLDGQREDLAVLASRVDSLKSTNTATKFLIAVSCIQLAWKFDRCVQSDPRKSEC